MQEGGGAALETLPTDERPNFWFAGMNAFGCEEVAGKVGYDIGSVSESAGLQSSKLKQIDQYNN